MPFLACLKSQMVFYFNCALFYFFFFYFTIRIILVKGMSAVIVASIGSLHSCLNDPACNLRTENCTQCPLQSPTLHQKENVCICSSGTARTSGGEKTSVVFISYFFPLKFSELMIKNKVRMTRCFRRSAAITCFEILRHCLVYQGNDK